MADDKALPFHSFAFTLVENRRPRASLRLSAAEGGYELHVQKGSAANPSSQFTRQVPVETAERLREALQEIGVFGWEEQYGDATAPGSRRWTMSAVLREGVFSVESKGGSDVPPGFDALLEELYRLDFPRPAAQRASGGRAARGIGSAVNASGIGGLGGLGGIGGMSAADLSALAASGKFGDLGELGDPQELQQRMKDEFRHMPPDEQRQLIDALVQTGLGTRDFWERFFRS